MLKLGEGKEVKNILEKIYCESGIDVVGFFDVHRYSKKLKRNVPPKKSLFNAIKKKGFKACDTHFRLEGIRSDISPKEFLRIMKKV